MTTVICPKCGEIHNTSRRTNVYTKVCFSCIEKRKKEYNKRYVQELKRGVRVKLSIDEIRKISKEKAKEIRKPIKPKRNYGKSYAKHKQSTKAFYYVDSNGKTVLKQYTGDVQKLYEELAAQGHKMV